MFEVGTDCRVLPQQMVPLQEAATIFVLQLNGSRKPSVLPPHPSTSVRKVKEPFCFSPFGGLKMQQGPFCKVLLHFPIPDAVCLDIVEPKADAPEL